MTPINQPIAEQGRVVSVGDYVRGNIREYGMFIALIAIMVFFQFSTGGVLFRPLNLTNIILQNSFIVIMALGMLLVIVAGHIDLSVGSVVGFIGAIAGVMTVQWHTNYVLAGIVCLAMGALVGGIQGYFVAYHKIPSFIVTLAGMLVFRGLTLFVMTASGTGTSIGPFPPAFQLISIGFLPNAFDMGGINSTSIILTVVGAVTLFYLAWRKRLSNEKHGNDVEPLGFFLVQNALVTLAILALGYQLSIYRGFPNVLMVMLVLVAAYAFITRRTTIGRRIYAMGGNEKATKLSGINTERLTFLTFANMGLLAGLAGLIVALRLNSATAKGGFGLELDVIAACFIGGASAQGGVGKVTGAVIGALIMGIMNNGMSIHGLGTDSQQMVKGAVLLAAVFFDVYNKNKG
ncbi:multiple monosaccharide ABC transporter permease [Rhizobium leguminosarum]|jgi:putative multiple sugar transport system permease protein|uniref:Xylose transport system permease protein XylH n=2 Tax=Rhizobium TaxID=379 RepID=A0A2Z4YDP0_RHILE|nr:MULTISPECIES: multiple monosaccharide ABC transporter permease [Rhizobium]MDH6657641.1 putative multiple sugar transport system permease protein [Rhizobium sophorae]ASS56182.1 ABC transporter permease [Rhizobium leguminosarum bv. viciae]AVC51019.1 branched-chain amino acid transport system / permease component family protein [Rhizobium leguminosarum bv. viciae]AXA39381.1 Branched-chain amino acid transport system / permease component family protein [Rhizobium leguminosarum]MBA8836491.1 puta